MDQNQALSIMLRGESVLLTGPAGSGKTFILNRFINEARERGKMVAVTATTGLAATHLNGGTIHSWAGIGIHNSLPDNFFDKFPAHRRSIIKNTDVLIIDEVSMLHDYRLDLVDTLTRRIREKDESFGGLQVILCGDFFQLPPISRMDEPTSQFIVHASSYQDLNPVVCYLNEQHRQDDSKYLSILNSIRNNEVSDEQYITLQSRINASFLTEGDVTELHTTNIDVDSLNSKKLELLKGDTHSYNASYRGKQNYIESLKRSCLAMETLELKKGALVICIKNNPEKRYINGSLGIVIGFDPGTDYPIISLISNNRTVTIEPETWELTDGDIVNATLEQIPLRLAWAITIHKSQGMTLDAARIDLRRTFVPGMGYVALSRIRNLESLSLLGISPHALLVSDEALEIDAQLRTSSHKDAQRLSFDQDKAPNQ